MSGWWHSHCYLWGKKLFCECRQSFITVLVNQLCLDSRVNRDCCKVMVINHNHHLRTWVLTVQVAAARIATASSPSTGCLHIHGPLPAQTDVRIPKLTPVSIIAFLSKLYSVTATPGTDPRGLSWRVDEENTVYWCETAVSPINCLIESSLSKHSYHIHLCSVVICVLLNFPILLLLFS